MITIVKILNSKISKKISIDNIIFFFSSILLFICVFDPAGLLFGIKDKLFVLIVLLFISNIFIKKRIAINVNLFVYIFVFSVVLPLISLVTYFVFQKSHGVTIDTGILKTFLFLLFGFIVFSFKKDVLKIFVTWLCILSILIIAVYIVIRVFPNSTNSFFLFGNKYLIFTIAIKYLAGFSVVRVYFWTSPLILIAISYCFYFYRKTSKKRYLVLTVVNLLGLLLSGSRANFVASIFIIPIIYYYYSTPIKKIYLMFVLLVIIVITGLIKYHVIYEMFFNPLDESNKVKILMVSDYINIYRSNIPTFLFGQGVGSEFYIPSRHMTLTFSELTYFELFRRFGFVLGSIYLYLMIYPIRFLKRDNQGWLYLSYLLYLVIAFFNPFYFSSTGILFLSIVLATHYKYSNESKIDNYIS
ncbi:MAG TPA: hypothetical protein VMW01_01265 [Williamwhitmania sp.]|nr:hypothetical protein [Williamwhitmania sp.]